MKYLIVFSAFLIILISCKGKNEPSTNTDTNYELKKKELELKEKEIELKENEMKNRSRNYEDKTNVDQNTVNRNKVDLEGMYGGTIKDGTSWIVYITSSEHNSLKGYNQIYWKSNPDGFKTNFTGTYDTVTGEILMYEDRNAKGSGLFRGIVSKDGNSMNGTWKRYTDDGSFKWSLQREFEEDDEGD